MAYIGMIEGGSGSGFAEKSLVGGSILLHVLGQKLEGDLAAERKVIREEDFAHASLAQLFNDSVVRNRFADHGD